MLASACQGDSTVVLTATPALSPTSQSTPLAVDSQDQAGSLLRIFLVPEGSIEEAQSVVADLVSALQDETGLKVEINLSEQSAQAILALCESGSDVVSVAWLDGIAFSVAHFLGCGQPVLQVERGRGADASTGKASSIIARKSLSIDKLSDLEDRRFCRINHRDNISWLVPSILMNRDGLSPASLRTVSDVEDVESLIESVVRGDCDAAGVPADALEQFADQFGEDLEKVVVVATSPVIPYSILVADSRVPAATQERLSEELRKLTQDRSLSQKLQLLLDQSALEAVNEEDFEAFIEFVTTSGLDLAQLGN